MLVGSVNASGGFPATPGVPSVSSTRPSGLNLTTVCPFFSFGNFAASRGFGPRWSATQMFPSRSTYTLWGKTNIPAPKLRHEIAILVELHHGRQRRSRTTVVLERRRARRRLGVGTASVGHPHGFTVAIDPDRVQRAPRPTRWQLPPLVGARVRVGGVVGRLLRVLGVHAPGTQRDETRNQSGRQPASFHPHNLDRDETTLDATSRPSIFSPSS